MTVSYVGAGSYVSGYQVDLTPSLPTGWQAGDLLILIQTGFSGHNTLPSGWTSFIATSYGTGEISCWIRVSWKIATPAEQNPTFYASRASSQGTVVAYRGAHPSSPINATQFSPGFLLSVPDLTFSSVTSSIDGCGLMLIAGANDNYTWSSWTNVSGTPPEITEAVQGAERGDGESYGMSLAVATSTAAQPMSGATGTYTVTPKKNDRGFCKVTVAIAPAPTPTIDPITAASHSSGLISLSTSPLPSTGATAQSSGSVNFSQEIIATIQVTAHVSGANANSDTTNVAATARSNGLAEVLEQADIESVQSNSQGLAAISTPQETTIVQGSSQASASADIVEEISVTSIARSNSVGVFTAEQMAIIEAIARAGTNIPLETLDILATGGAEVIVSLSGRFNPTNYLMENIRISRSVNDSHWIAEMRIDNTNTPSWWEPFEIELEDHNGTPQMLFLGLVPGSEYNLQAAANKARSVAYSQTWYLDQQYLTPDQLNMGLDDNVSWNDWADVISDLLGDSNWESITGIEPYKMNVPDTDTQTKRFSFQPRTTKMQAIRDIAKFCGFLFLVKPRWTGIEWRSSAYFVSLDDIDDAVDGIDLPSPVKFNHPDPHVVSIPSVDDLGQDKYNRIIIRGHDSSGTWFTSTVESPNVTAGIVPAREYYEESVDYDTQTKCNIRAQEVYSLYNLVCKTVKVTFLNRTDLQLLQQIELSGYDSCLDISETYFRIIDITYEQSAGSTLVHATCTPDRLNGSTWQTDLKSPDMVTETEIVAEEVVRNIPTGDPGIVSSVSGNIVTVNLERGGTIEARAVGTDPLAGDSVFIQPQIDGSYVIAGGGGMRNPVMEPLDMGGFKFYLYKDITDTESCYLWWDITNNRLEIHLPTLNNGVAWTVG